MTQGAETMPRSVVWLGYGGLLPFVTLALAGLLPEIKPAAQQVLLAALLAYGAVILSFVGALHWGFAISSGILNARQRNACFLWSVVPALLAWPTFFLPARVAGAVLVIGFLAHYLQDRRLVRYAGLPQWYLPLRLRLTTVACVCLAVPGCRAAVSSTMVNILSQA